MKNMDRDSLKLLQRLSSFSQKRVLLVGETIVDHYVYGTVIGTSLETPTLVAKEQKQEFSLGGASLVCRNLLALGAEVTFYTLTGNDPESQLIRDFSHPRLCFCTVYDEKKQATVKRRYWVDGYKLLQMDRIDNKQIAQNVEDKVVSDICTKLAQQDALIFADYRVGLLTPSLISKLIEIANGAGVAIYVDSQISQQMSANHSLYKRASVVCLNYKEACAVNPLFSSSVEREAVKRLSEILQVDNIVVKKGKEGASALINNIWYEERALPCNAVDTCGAGDAFLAALSLAGLDDPSHALKLANMWAGLSTQIRGPHPPHLESLEKLLK